LFCPLISGRDYLRAFSAGGDEDRLTAVLRNGGDGAY
jgi:hypothetical protein